jgi:hypothetical protein
MKYAFIRAHRGEFGVRAMCRVLRVHFSGFYAWLKEPLSHRAQEDARQTELIRQAWSDSGKVYGYRKLTDDLRDQGERISENRVARLASLAGIAAQIGYRRRPGRYGGKPAVVVENRLEQKFETSAPDQIWVTDITYIKTHEGWLYLCVVHHHLPTEQELLSSSETFLRKLLKRYGRDRGESNKLQPYEPAIQCSNLNGRSVRVAAGRGCRVVWRLLVAADVRLHRGDRQLRAQS